LGKELCRGLRGRGQGETEGRIWFKKTVGPEKKKHGMGGSKGSRTNPDPIGKTVKRKKAGRKEKKRTIGA